MIRHSKHVQPTCLPVTANDTDIVSLIADLRTKADSIYLECTSNRSYKTALDCLKEMRQQIALVAEITGKKQTHTTTNNFLFMPEWTATRNAILKALSEYPTAKEAVIKAIGSVK
jgi:hypothetical protein